MKTLFADTFYYIALLNQSDSQHDRAVEVTNEFEGAMMTTTAVLTELGDGIAGTSGRELFADEKGTRKRDGSNHGPLRTPILSRSSTRPESRFQP